MGSGRRQVGEGEIAGREYGTERFRRGPVVVVLTKYNLWTERIAVITTTVVWVVYPEIEAV